MRKLDDVNSVVRNKFYNPERNLVHEMFRNIHISGSDYEVKLDRAVTLLLKVEFSNDLHAVVEYRTPDHNTKQGYEILDDIISTNDILDEYIAFRNVKLIVPRQKFLSTDELSDKILSILYHNGPNPPTSVFMTSEEVTLTMTDMNDFSLTYNTITQTYKNELSFLHIIPSVRSKVAHSLPPIPGKQLITPDARGGSESSIARRELIETTILDIINEKDFASAQDIHRIVPERISHKAEDLCEGEIDFVIDKMLKADLITAELNYNGKRTLFVIPSKRPSFTNLSGRLIILELIFKYTHQTLEDIRYNFKEHITTPVDYTDQEIDTVVDEMLKVNLISLVLINGIVYFIINEDTVSVVSKK